MSASVAEALAGSFIVQCARGEDFQCEIPAQSFVAHAEHHAHAAGPDLLDNFVPAQNLTDAEEERATVTVQPSSSFIAVQWTRPFCTSGR